MVSAQRRRRRRTTLAAWQIRARARHRRHRATTLGLVLALVVVIGMQWRAARPPDVDVGPESGPPSAPTAAAPHGADRPVEGGPGRHDEPDGATIGAGERVLAIARPAAAPPLAPGDRVEIISIALDANDRPVATTLGPPMRVVSADDPGAIVLAVPGASVGRLLAAQATGPLDVVLTASADQGR